MRRQDRTDAQRDQPRVLARFTCSARSQVLPGGKIIEHGTHEIEMYRDDFDHAVAAHVETALDEWEQCIRVDARKRANATAKGTVHEGSPQAEFQALMDRDVRVLTNPVVLRELPSPVAERGSMDDRIADAVAKALPGAVQAALAALGIDPKAQTDAKQKPKA